jgi:DNA-directed RNA polymerase specialized sigma24 family protein
MTNKPELRPENSRESANISQEHSDALNASLLRYRRVLQSVAYRVLFNHRDAEAAVQSLFLSAPNNIPKFECEGSFRSWLLRGVIDEALGILKNRITRPTCGKPIPHPPRFVPRSGQTCGAGPPSFDKDRISACTS